MSYRPLLLYTFLSTSKARSPCRAPIKRNLAPRAPCWCARYNSAAVGGLPKTFSNALRLLFVNFTIASVALLISNLSSRANFKSSAVSGII